MYFLLAEIQCYNLIRVANILKISVIKLFKMFNSDNTHLFVKQKLKLYL